MSINSNLAFGSRLRAHRERRGLTLAVLADSLKVKQSLLDQLERDDVTRWPPGIYGRAIVREYAKLIDLPPDEIVQQFILLSGTAEEQRDSLSIRERQSADAGPLRLTLADPSARRAASLSRRVVAAGAELMLVLATGFLVASISGLPGWTANAIVALTWYPVRTAFWSHDSLYRIMRLQRLTTSVLWSHTTEIPPIASLMSNGRTVVEELVDSVEEPFIVETDVNPATSSSPSVH